MALDILSGPVDPHKNIGSVRDKGFSQVFQIVPISTISSAELKKLFFFLRANLDDSNQASCSSIFCRAHQLSEIAFHILFRFGFRFRGTRTDVSTIRIIKMEFLELLRVIFGCC